MKVNDRIWLNDSHYQSYVILNLCRILYAVRSAALDSKKTVAGWIKAVYPQWVSLVRAAENWEYGKEMKLNERAIEFIQFVKGEIEKSPLFGEAGK